MLKILRWDEPVKADIKFDFYVPVTIDWGIRAGEIIYWRTGDLTYSLLELGMDSKDGRIASFTLVSFSNITGMDSSCSMETVLSNGLPVFDIPNHLTPLIWENRFIDHREDFKVCLWKEYVEIQFANFNPDWVQYAQSGRVLFGQDKKQQLCAIGVTALTTYELQELKS